MKQQFHSIVTRMHKGAHILREYTPNTGFYSFHLGVTNTSKLFLRTIAVSSLSSHYSKAATATAKRLELHNDYRGSDAPPLMDNPPLAVSLFRCVWAIC